MSLTSIIYNQKEIRDGLLARAARPAIRLGPIRVAPLTTHYRLIGTAFDYLLRFVLQRTNPNAQSRMWVAERGIEQIGASEYVYQMDKSELRSKTDRQRLEADRHIADAKGELRRYLESGVLTDRLLEAALRLATLDVAYRAGPDLIDWAQLKKPDPLDVADMRALLALVNEADFRARRVCLLNPDFGRASELVEGADADLLVDDTLIDIKTTKTPQIDSRDFCQLIGYYLLYGFDGVHGGRGRTEEHHVSSLGVYFSRYGYLWKAPVTSLIPEGSLREVSRWFFSSVCKPAAKRQKYVRAFKGPLAIHLAASERLGAGSKKRRPRAKLQRRVASTSKSGKQARRKA